MDRFDEGAEALSRAAVLKPDSHDALHTLANALKGAGRYDEAIAALWRAVELQPMSAALHDDLSRLAWEDDRTDMFLKSFAHVRERFDEDPALLTTEAQIRMQRNDAQGAEPLLRRALVLSPERGDTNALLGRLLARRGRFDESYEAFSAAVRVAPQIAAFTCSTRAQARCQSASLAEIGASSNMPALLTRVSILEVPASACRQSSSAPSVVARSARTSRQRSLPISPRSRSAAS